MAEEAADVKPQVETDTTTTESSTVESNDDGVFALDIMGDRPAEDIKESESEEVVDKKSAAEDKKSNLEENAKDSSDDTPRKNAETRKQQLNNEIRDKIAERNALKREIAELNQQKYQMKTTSDIPTVEALMDQVNPETGDYYTRTEAKLAHLEAERELERAQKRMDDYTETIVDNRLRLRDEASRALKDFPIFDTDSSSYNQGLTEQADRIAQSLIIKDEKTGEVIGARGSVYEVYAAIANAARSAEADGRIAGRKAALNMANSADVVGSSVPSTPSEDDDPFLKGMKRGME